MENSTENRSDSGQNSSERSETILTGTGISYAQIPRRLFKLTEFEGITCSDAFLALSMFDWCHQKHRYPKFRISHSELAQVTKLSRRQVMYGIERLIDLKVILARQNAGQENEYQWNEYFLQTGITTGANSAHGDVQSLHMGCANSAHGDVQSLHPIYIEFLLDFLFKFYLDYFSSSECLIKRVPPRRGQKGVAKDFATHFYITRKDAWKEAIEYSYKKCGSWVRIYVALAGGFAIEKVTYPRAYLSKLIWDESHQWESKKKSYLEKRGHLDSDEAFLKFILDRKNRINSKNDQVPEPETDLGKIEITYMTGLEPQGEELT